MKALLPLVFILSLGITCAEEPAESVVQIDKAQERIQLVRRNRELLFKMKNLKKEADDLQALVAGTTDKDVQAKITEELKIVVLKFHDTVLQYKKNIAQLQKTVE